MTAQYYYILNTATTSRDFVLKGRMVSYMIRKLLNFTISNESIPISTVTFASPDQLVLEQNGSGDLVLERFNIFS